MVGGVVFKIGWMEWSAGVPSSFGPQYRVEGSTATAFGTPNQHRTRKGWILNALHTALHKQNVPGDDLWYSGRRVSYL